MEVEVDLAGGVARLAGREYPVRIVSGESDRVELEIAGEKVVVEGWWKGLSEPPRAEVAVNGEAVRAELTARSAEAAAPGPRAPAPPAALRPVGSAASSPAPPADAGPGVAIVPPMPGKVIELRVAEGEHVAAGQVVLVLEAMKMRNEVTTPLAGRVVDVRVAAGANVRAKEPMLRVVPD